MVLSRIKSKLEYEVSKPIKTDCFHYDKATEYNEYNEAPLTNKYLDHLVQNKKTNVYYIFISRKGLLYLHEMSLHNLMLG